MATSAPHPSVLAVGRALPPHYADQETTVSLLRKIWSTRRVSQGRLEALHKSVMVKGRYLALPLEAYPTLDSFEQRNDAFIRVAEELAAVALTRATGAAGLSPRDVNHIFFVTVTGVAAPSIDARVVNRLGMRSDVKRTPVFGLGCVAGAAGTARAADYLRAFPDQIAALVSVELCSLTYQRDDTSVANIIASGLFGDGAAAVLLAGSERASDLASFAPSSRQTPRVVATRSVFYPNTEDLMGWRVGSGGFRVVLSPKVPELVRERVGADVDAFLHSNGLERSDIRHWIAHTGGPKVLSALEGALELPEGALARSWRALAATGNLSSASVLFVLGDLLDGTDAAPGDIGLLFAMGPGFCSEMVLLQW